MHTGNFYFKGVWCLRICGRIYLEGIFRNGNIIPHLHSPYSDSLSSLKELSVSVGVNLYGFPGRQTGKFLDHPHWSLGIFANMKRFYIGVRRNPTFQVLANRFRQDGKPIFIHRKLECFSGIVLNNTSEYWRPVLREFFSSFDQFPFNSWIMFTVRFFKALKCFKCLEPVIKCNNGSMLG